MADGPKMIPFLRYEDAPAALDWLTNAFGFEQHLVVPGDEGAIAHAELKLGNSFVMVGTVRKDDDLRLHTPGELGGITQGIYCVVDDVDAHHARAAGAGANVVYGPEDTDYGSREYGATDPEGHLWTFGSYGPG